MCHSTTYVIICPLTSNDLLRRIDENYCRHSNGISFDYNKRNYSTSHVHMMLSIALSKMLFMPSMF